MSRHSQEPTEPVVVDVPDWGQQPADWVNCDNCGDPVGVMVEEWGKPPCGRCGEGPF
ncbi:MAG: hypothetical protein OSB57_11450 [Planctomycetota bacterium]|nr:hypothetical protein [Planctomycetota bacterium]